MTLIVAWIDKENAFVTGDTAVTRTYSKKHLDKIERSNTQRNPITDNVIIQVDKEVKLIQQESLKIYEIGENFIYAFAGNAQRGHEIAIFLRDNFNEDVKAEELLKEAIEANGHSGIQCVIVTIASGEPQLISINTRDISGNLFRHSLGEAVILGKKYWDQSTYFMESIIAKAYKARTTEYDRLISVCGMIQSHIIRSQLIDVGIGGIYCGVVLCEQFSKWTDNYVIVQYSYDKYPDQERLERLSNVKLTFVSIIDGRIVALTTEDGIFKRENVLYTYYKSYEYQRAEDRFGKSLPEWKVSAVNMIEERMASLEFETIIYLDVVGHLNRVVIAKNDETYKEYNGLSWSDSRLNLQSGFDILYGLAPKHRIEADELEWYS